MAMHSIFEDEAVSESRMVDTAGLGAGQRCVVGL
jgi:hypothetical protein